MAMEAAPRLPMLSFDLKVPNTPPKWAPKLKKYIAECYREDPESYNNEIQQLEGLRASAVTRPAIDASSAAAMKRYFCQLRRLKSRFPMSSGQPVAVSFAWKDLFADVVCTMADIRFEMDCVLYNIGALHSKLGALETRTNPDSMKYACTHFQVAAWTFQHLKDHYPRPSGVDLSPEIIKLFQDICLAQAQECILEKSMQDSRKPAIVGAIGMQTVQHYKCALSALESSQSGDSLRETVGVKTCNAWNKYLSFKIAYISSIVYLFQGMQSEESQKMGERVAYYQLACDKLQDAKKLTKGLAQIEIINEAIIFTNDVVEGKRKAAKNENEFIYHEEVPDKELLGEPKPASLAKGIPINFNDPEVAGTDIFNRLVPMRAHEASSMYSEEKATLLRKVTGDVEAKDSELNDFMSSLQLDELNVLNEPERLPQDLIDICASLSAKTDAIQNLIETMNGLADIHTEVESMFTEIKSLIEAEERSEKDFQQIIGKRPPSIVSTELSREANKYLEAHNKANESNQTLHKAMTLHLANLKLLSLPLDELNKHVPSLETIRSNIDVNAMTEMRLLVEKVNEMRAQRSMFILQLREAINADDITSQLLTRTGESLDEIFKQEMEKHNKTVNLVNQNMLAQENILKALTEAYAKYAPSKKLISDILKKKESFLTAMKTSYETYEDLLNKSLKGIEFYRKLSSTVSRLLTRLKSTCKVQQEERAQLLASHSSKSGVSQIPKNPSTTVGMSSNTPKEEVSSGPKLKDYLPYMKNRSSISHSTVADTADTSFSGHLYPPYVRPAPLGSEEKNEPVSYSYSDSSYNTTQTKIPESEVYKQNYPASYMNPELNTYAMGTDQYSAIDPKMYSNIQYPTYYPYTTNMTGDNLKEMNPNNVGSSVYGAVTSVPQYDPGVSTPQQYSSATNYNYYGATYDTMADNQTYPGLTQTMYPQNQMNYPNNLQSQYPEQSQLDYNTMMDQMKNMNVNNQIPNTSIPNPMPNVNVSSIPNQIQQPASFYGAVDPHLSNAQQMYNPSAQYPTSNLYPTHAYPITSIQQAESNISTSTQNTLSYNMTQMPTAQNMSVPSSLPADSTYLTSMYSTVETNLSNSYQAPIVSSTSNPGQPLQSPYYPQVSSVDSTISQYTDIKPVIDNVMSAHTAGFSPVSQSTPSLQFPVSQQSVVPPTAEPQPGSFSPSIPTDGDLPIKSHVQREFLPKNNAAIPHILNYNTNNHGPNSPVSLPNVLGATNENTELHSTNYNTSDSTNNTLYQNNAYGYDDKTGLGNFNYGYTDYSVIQQQTAMNPGGTLPDNQYQQNLYTNPGYYDATQNMSNLQNVEQINTEISTQYTMPYNQYQHINNEEVKQEPVQPNVQHSSLAEQTDLADHANSMKKDSTANVAPNQGKASENVSNTNSEVKQAVEKVKEPSSIDLLSGLDFSIEQAPLMPQIRVPPVSEHVIRKVPQKDIFESKISEINDKPEDETPVRPAKRDIFADPSLLNKFTQEVKTLQQVVDSFTKKTHSGITMLDSKWKKLQDLQAKNSHTKSTQDGKDNINKNMSPDVITYDDSRVKLTSEYSNEYINASHIKQLSSWCIPLIVSDLPREDNFTAFWHMIYQQKIDLIVCLVTEIELQGNFYVPTSKNQVLEFSQLSIRLDEMLCNVNWTERKLTIKYKNVERNISHYQINVFPARVVSSPLVMLVDKILNTMPSEGNDNVLPKALIHCNTGAGRSSLIVLLTMAICQVRAGFVDLRDMLDSGLLDLCDIRTNFLEDTKYIVDVYRTVLFYVQGVLCSGTVMFNGEAVSVQTGASVPPPAIVSNPRKNENLNKFSKESFEEMKQAAGLKSGDMQDPLSYLDPMWSLKKRKD